MQVFANLCEPHSFLRSIMKAGETYKISDCDFFDGLSLPTTNLKNAFPNNPITVPVTGHSVFAKIYIDYMVMAAVFNKGGDYRKFFEVFNLAGKLLFSIGFKDDPLVTGKGIQPLVVYMWNDNGTLKSSKSETSQLYPLALAEKTENSDRTPNRALAYYYHNDPNDLANTRLDIYYGAEILLTMTGTEFGNQTDRDPAKLYFFRNTLNFLHRISYIVVTDTLDLSLEPLVVKPAVLTYSTGFTGTVSNLQDELQDEKYVSSSAVTGRYIEFTVDKYDGHYSRFLADGRLISGSMYFYGRYLQTGGTSVTFNISIYNGAELYHTEDIVVLANQNSAYYQTTLSTKISSALAGLKSNRFKSFKVRISLKEV